MENLMEVRQKVEGMTLVRNRMKLIKIANRSRFDWKTAEEYQQDDLASGS